MTRITKLVPLFESVGKDLPSIFEIPVNIKDKESSRQVVSTRPPKLNYSVVKPKTCALLAKNILEKYLGSQCFLLARNGWVSEVIKKAEVVESKDSEHVGDEYSIILDGKEYGYVSTYNKNLKNTDHATAALINKLGNSLDGDFYEIKAFETKEISFYDVKVLGKNVEDGSTSITVRSFVFTNVNNFVFREPEVVEEPDVAWAILIAENVYRSNDKEYGWRSNDGYDDEILPLAQFKKQANKAAERLGDKHWREFTSSIKVYRDLEKFMADFKKLSGSNAKVDKSIIDQYSIKKHLKPGDAKRGDSSIKDTGLFESDALNESDSFENEVKYLRNTHPKSGSTELFISKVSDIISNKIDMIERSFFRLKMGDQWGLEFVDSLVDSGILGIKKINRTEFLVAKGFDEYAKTKELLKKEVGFSSKLDKGKFIIEINIMDDKGSIYKNGVVNYVKDIKKQLEELNPEKTVILTETDLNKEKIRNRYLSNDVLYKGIITIS